MISSSVRIAAILALAAPVLSTQASAQKGGMPGGAPAAPAMRSAPAAPAIRAAPAAPAFRAAPAAPAFRAAPAAPRMVAPSAPRFAPSAPRMAPAYRAAPRVVTPRPGINRPSAGARVVGKPAGVRQFQRPGTTATAPSRIAPQTPVARPGRDGKPVIARPTVPGTDARATGLGRTDGRAALVNPALGRKAGVATPARLVNPVFAGKVRPAAGRAVFAGNYAHAKFRPFHRRHFHRGFVLGFVGPLFWPYAYDDFVDYVYWPYASDAFWPYAYDDVYEGIFGGYAGIGGPRIVAGGGARPAPRIASAPSRGYAPSVCSTQQASALIDFPIEQITETVQPNDEQRAALEELKAATAGAVKILQDACPTELPATPTGRLAATRKRLEAMLQAVQTVRPALDRFYQSLSDEQKARFNAVAFGRETEQAGRDQRDLTQLCSARGNVAGVPLDRIAQAVRPTGAQQGALDELRQASARAADVLKENCPTVEALTPTGRVEAMEKRLAAMLEAVKAVEPALASFYEFAERRAEGALQHAGCGRRPGVKG